MTSPDKLTEELFTHRGAGTLIMRGEKVQCVFMFFPRAPQGGKTASQKPMLKAVLPLSPRPHASGSGPRMTWVTI